VRGVAAWPADLGTALREWGRIGVTGFGGPPAHMNSQVRVTL
jgi:chromate transport protein ChrA